MTFQEALEICLKYDDIDRVREELAHSGVHHDYVSWEEVTENQNVRLDRLVRIGVSRAEAARREGKRAFVSKDDGNGVHVFFEVDEPTLVSVLAHLACVLRIRKIGG